MINYDNDCSLLTDVFSTRKVKVITDKSFNSLFVSSDSS